MLKKGVWITGAIVLALIVVFFLTGNSKFTGNVVLSEINFPSDCSSSNLNSTWSELMNTSLTNVRFACNVSDDGMFFLAQKNISNSTFSLFGLNDGDVFSIIGVYGNFSSDTFILNLSEMEEYVISPFDLLLFQMSIQNPISVSRASPISIDTAKVFFKSKFNLDVSQGEWIYNETVYEEQTYSMFYNLTEAHNFASYKQVYNTIDQATFSISHISEENTPHNSIDFSNANLNFNAALKVNGSLFNSSQNYSDSNTFEILQGNRSRVKFNWNLTENYLNFSNVFIEKQTNSSSFGYLIVNGINTRKTVYVDKILGSNKLCVKDASISNISEVSLNCNSSNEYLISCPNTTGNYACSVLNDSYEISGLMHSAVSEVYVCEEDWSCGGFGACQSGTQTRTCTDLNNCGTNLTMPSLTQQCTVCNPNWQCGNWTPSKCPSSGNQTRSCTDLNSCGVATNKPSEVQSCEYKSSSGWIIILVIILLISIIGGVGFAIYYSARKNSEENSNPSPPNSLNPSNGQGPQFGNFQGNPGFR